MVIFGCQVKPWGPSIPAPGPAGHRAGLPGGAPGCPVVVSGGQGPTTHYRGAGHVRLSGGVRRGAGTHLAGGPVPQHLAERPVCLASWRKGADTSAGVVLVSSGFHLTRARMLWERASGGAGDLSTLAAPAPMCRPG